MVEETSDEPIAAYGAWFAVEVTETTEMTAGESTAEPDDAPWETAAEAVATGAEATQAEPTEAYAQADATEPETNEPIVATAEPELVQAEDVTDSFVAGQAPWDAPETFEWVNDDTVDDRSMDMYALYDDMFPVVNAALAAAAAQPARDTQPVAMADDADDSAAPILNDVEQQAAPNWTLWQPPIDVIDSRGPNQPAFVGKIVGPTPPDDLFGTTGSASDTSDADETANQTANDEPESSNRYDVSAEIEQAVARQLPALYSTATASPAQPLVVRIELTIRDETNKVRSAEMARRVGPWEAESEQPTARHPEFEPRIHLANAPTEDVDTEADTPPAAPAAPAAATASAPAAPTAAVPTAATPAPEPEVWERAQVFDPWAPPAPEPAHAAEVAQPAQRVDVPWADWTLEPNSTDPLSSLPAATFAPVAAQSQQTVQQPSHPAYAVQAPAFDSENRVKSVPSSAAPVSASQTAAVAAATPRSSASGDQSDLWFLASEPDGFIADQPGADKQNQPSKLLTAGLTVAMAVVVVILVLVFILVMTSLLK